MPDQPGKGPPPSTPLSVEAADRLAESFTPIWEVESEPVPPAVPAAPVTVSKPVTKHPTLLGMAPFSFGQPTPSVPTPTASVAPGALSDVPLPVAPAARETPSPMAQSPAEPTGVGTSGQPLPAAAPAQSISVAESPVQLQVSAGPSGTEAMTVPASVDPVTIPTPSQHPTREVPGYAIAYTPKDGPGTPAVVIAPEAQSSPENARPFSLTIPARGRAVEVVPPEPPATDERDSFLPPNKRNIKRISAVVGGAILLAAGVLLGVRALSGPGAPVIGAPGPPRPPSRPEPGNGPVPTPLLASPPPAREPFAQPQAAESSPRALPVPSLAGSAPAPSDRKPARTGAEPKKVSTGAELKKAVPARARAAPITAATTRPASRPAGPASLPSVSPTAATNPAPGKAVIVRDTPF